MPPRRYLVLALLLAAPVGLVALICNPFAPTEVETLRAMDEADLAYPGAYELVYEERLPEWSPFGTSPTYFVWLFGMQAAAEDVESWYDAELAARGWVPSRSGHMFSTQYEQTIRGITGRNAGPAPMLDLALREELTEQFRDDIERTAELTGQDLSLWLQADRGG